MRLMLCSLLALTVTAAVADDRDHARWTIMTATGGTNTATTLLRVRSPVLEFPAS
jgi:hypothetical protein